MLRAQMSGIPFRDLRTGSADRYREQFLYDLAADPYELTNLAGFESHRRVSEELRARLIRRMVEAGEAAPLIEAAPAVASGQRIVYEEEAFE